VGVVLALACGHAAAAGAAGFLVAAPVGKSLVLRAAPGGPVVARLGRRTEFGTAVALGVVERRGRWLGVTTDALPNGMLGWVDARTARVRTVAVALRVRLAQRRLDVVVGARVLRSFAIGVGTAASPTPTGRFAVAEKLDGTRYGPVWGCCILGLSAHQPHPPGSWSAGRDYLVAIHGGGGIGTAVSGGCLHLDDASLRYLMRTVPVGTPVFVS
jgi:lipoprotein-anchoring transpeptidase ErfK/SrfK